MKITTVLLATLCLLIAACNGPQNASEYSEYRASIDSCENAVIYPMAQALEMVDEPKFTGELNNYWGDDTDKLDFVHTYKAGVLVKSEFYYENGNVQEEYNFKCQSLHGNVKHFYENGTLAVKVPYSFGRKNGVGFAYDPDGSVLQTIVFEFDSIVDQSGKYERVEEAIEDLDSIDVHSGD